MNGSASNEVARSHQAQASRTPSFSLQDMLFLVFRYKYSILVCVLLGLAGAVLVYMQTVPVFRSEASLLVRYITDRTATDPGTMGAEIISPDQRGRNVLNTELQILGSHDIAQVVVDSIGIDRSDRGMATPSLLRRITNRIGLGGKPRAPAPHATAEMIRRNLSLSNPRDSNIIKASFVATDPMMAQSILDGLIHAYLEKHFEMHRASGAYEFLAQQVDQARSRLEDTEQRLREAKNAIGVDSIEMANERLATRRQELKDRVLTAEAMLAASQARVEALRNVIGAQVGETPGTPSPSPEKDEATADLIERLRVQEMHLLGTYTEDSAVIRSLRDRIRSLEVMSQSTQDFSVVVADVPRAGLATDSLRVELRDEESKIAASQANVMALNMQLAGLREEQETIFKASGNITELQRKKEIDEASYRYFSQRLEEARIDDVLDVSKMSNISIVQPATKPISAQRPDLMRNMALAIAAGLLAGLGLAFVRGRILNHAYARTSDVVADLPVPVLLSVPLGRNGRRLLPRSQKPRGLLGPGDVTAGAIAQAKAASAERMPFEDADGNFRPYFEALRDRVLQAAAGLDARPLLIGLTSCENGAGVSTMAGGLAATLAHNQDGRALLMQLSHLTHATAGGLWEDESSAGIVEFDVDERGRTTIMQPNIFVLPAIEMAGEQRQAAQHLRLEELVHKLRDSRYDFVIIDMAPAHETSLTMRVAPLLDAVLLVLAAGRTPRYRARHATQQLRRVGANVAGTVFNKKRRYAPEGVVADA